MILRGPRPDAPHLVLMTSTVSHLRSMAFTVLLIAVTACANYYQEPQQPTSQVATLHLKKVEHRVVNSFSMAIVMDIDGAPVNQYWQSASILPGRHSVDAAYRAVVGFSEDYFPVTIEFEAEAGVTYQVRAASDDNVVRIWIEEAETQRVVGVTTVVAEELD